MDDIGSSSQSNPGRHRECEIADHFFGMPRQRWLRPESGQCPCARSLAFIAIGVLHCDALPKGPTCQARNENSYENGCDESDRKEDPFSRRARSSSTAQIGEASCQ